MYTAGTKKTRANTGKGKLKKTYQEESYLKQPRIIDPLQTNAPGETETQMDVDEEPNPRQDVQENMVSQDGQRHNQDDQNKQEGQACKENYQEEELEGLDQDKVVAEFEIQNNTAICLGVLGDDILVVNINFVQFNADFPLSNLTNKISHAVLSFRLPPTNQPPSKLILL